MSDTVKFVGSAQPPFNQARLIEVIQSTLTERGAGSANDPVRKVTQYWSVTGELLAEVDPLPLSGTPHLEHPDKLQAELAPAQKTISDWEKAWTEMSDQASKLSTELSDQKERSRVLGLAVVNQTNANCRLEESCRLASQNEVELRELLEKSRADCMKLVDELDDARIQSALMGDKLSTAEAEREALKTQVAALERQLKTALNAKGFESPQQAELYRSRLEELEAYGFQANARAAKWEQTWKESQAQAEKYANELKAKTDELEQLRRGRVVFVSLDDIGSTCTNYLYQWNIRVRANSAGEAAHLVEWFRDKLLQFGSSDRFFLPDGNTIPGNVSAERKLLQTSAHKGGLPLSLTLPGDGVTDGVDAVPPRPGGNVTDGVDAVPPRADGNVTAGGDAIHPHAGA